MSQPVLDVRTEGGNTGSAGATSLAWNHTVGASLANSALVGTGQISNGSGSDITNYQWDAAGTPVALTKLGSIIDSAGFAHAALWYLKSPASGTKQVKITGAASAQIAGGSASYSTVDQTTPWNAASPQTATGSTAPQPSLAVTSGVNELAIASVADDENSTNDALTVSASSGTTGTINNDSIGVGLLSGRGDDAPGAATVTFTYAGAHAGDTTWAVIGGSLRGAPSGGGGYIQPLPYALDIARNPLARAIRTMMAYSTVLPTAPIVTVILQRRTLNDFGTHAGGRTTRMDS